VAVGGDDVDILAAIATVAESQGGLAALSDDQVLGPSPSSIADLLSEGPLEDVAGAHGAREQTGIAVIPEARVTGSAVFHGVTLCAPEPPTQRPYT
jgi:adenine deaminase